MYDPGARNIGIKLIPNNPSFTWWWWRFWCPSGVSSEAGRRICLMWRRTRRGGGATGTEVLGGISDALFLRLCDAIRAVRTAVGISGLARSVSCSSMPTSRSPIKVEFSWPFYFPTYVFPGVSAADNVCNFDATSLLPQPSFSVRLFPSFFAFPDFRGDFGRPWFKL